MQRKAVVAIAFSGGFRFAVKNMTLMLPAVRAVVFSPRKNQFEIGFRADRVGEELPKAWLASVTFVFCFAVKEGLVAACADKGPITLFIIQGA